MVWLALWYRRHSLATRNRAFLSVAELSTSGPVVADATAPLMAARHPPSGRAAEPPPTTPGQLGKPASVMPLSAGAARFANRRVAAEFQTEALEEAEGQT
jgi:hypothetical protein